MASRRKRYYGMQTELALKHFHIGRNLWPEEMIHAQTYLKIAAARANTSLKGLDSKRAKAIEKAGKEILDGRMKAEFPLSLWQSGSGTQFNMNVNEVIASRANEILTGKIDPKAPVHPNDHVNMSQSTNDTVPTALHVAVLKMSQEKLLPYMVVLRKSLGKKASAFRSIKKIGRTHLQDAVDLTLGDVFSGYESQIRFAEEELKHAAEGLREVPFGGTAVGTGLNAPKGFSARAVKELSTLAGITLKPSKNRFADQSAHARLVAFSGALKGTAVSLMKIANDIRFLGSGPHAGIGELLIPGNEPGSSIMPGKVNPTQCEALMMICTRVIGNDAAVTFGESALANFELQTAKPLFAGAIIESLVLLSDSVSSFDRFCVRGIKPNRERIAHNASQSLTDVTKRGKQFGYDNAASK